MELTVVGCSGSVSGPHSPASCYLLQAPYQGRTFSLVLDLGPGAFGALYRYLDPSRVDAIALSHLHPDHCLDVCAYYVASQYSPTSPWPPRPLYAPCGAAARLAAAYQTPAAVEDPEERGAGIAQHFDHHEWAPEQRIGPFDVRTARVAHPVETYAIRVQERRSRPDQEHQASMVFSGDTGPCDALVELSAGVDLLLVEAAFLEEPDLPAGLHLTPRQAVQAGTAAAVGRIMLTHIPPWHDPETVLAQALPHAEVPVLLAAPGSRYPIG